MNRKIMGVLLMLCMLHFATHGIFASSIKKFECISFTEINLGEYIRIWINNMCGEEIFLSVSVEPEENRCKPSPEFSLKAQQEITMDIYCPLHTAHYWEKFLIRKKSK
jgi:hypothetical protein